MLLSAPRSQIIYLQKVGGFLVPEVGKSLYMSTFGTIKSSVITLLLGDVSHKVMPTEVCQAVRSDGGSAEKGVED